MTRADFGSVMGRSVSRRGSLFGTIVATSTASDGTIRVWVEEHMTHAISMHWLEELSFASTRPTIDFKELLAQGR